MAFTNQDIIAAYNQRGNASEEDFAKYAMSQGVSADQLLAARSQLMAPQEAPAPAAPAADYMGRTFSDSDYAGARDWASGKDLKTLLGEASKRGLTTDQVGNILGVSGQQVFERSGYGQGASGIRPDGTIAFQYGWNQDPTKASNGQMYTSAYMGQPQSLSSLVWDKDKGFMNAPEAQGVMGTGTRSQGRDPMAYDTQNPYLSQMANTIGQQVGQNLARNILPGVRSQAQSVGGFGGSRQGVVESNVLNDATNNVANQIAGMYYGDYSSQLNRNLQQYQIDNQYDLGMGQLALGNKSADNTFSLGQGQLQLGNKTADNSYNLGLSQLSNQKDIASMQDLTNRYQADQSASVGFANANASSQASNNNFALGMRNADINEMTAGANIYQSLLTGMGNAGQSLYSAGTAQQNAPWNTINQFSGAMNPFSGFGQTQQTGGGAAGAVGGAIAGGQLSRLF